MAITKINTPELLDINTTGAKQLPSGTTAQRPTTGLTAGDFRYNTDDNRVEYYDGSAWFQIDDEALPLACTTDTINYPTGTTNTAYYKMSDATDSTLNAYNGTATDVDFNVQGKFGNAGEFNGSSSKIVLPASTVGTIVSNGSFAISAWFNTSTTGTRQFIFSAFQSSYIMLEVTTGNQLKGTVSNSAGTNTDLTVSTTVTDGNWHHAVFTGDSGSLALYLDNGTPQTSTSWNGSFYNGTGGVGIGIRMASSDYWNGLIDQVRIFDTEITAANVTSLYNEVQCVPAIIPSDYFNPVIYTGTGSTQSIDDLTFAPDFVWIKQRSSPVRDHVLHDIIRGSNKVLYSNLSNKQDTLNATYFTSFDSNGFTLGGDAYYNGGSLDYVAWNWKAGGAPTATNSAGAGNVPTAGSVKIDGADSTTALAGTIAATSISANTDAGFSIVSYTGNATSGATVGHGLSSRPDMYIVKNLSVTGAWYVYHTDVTTGKVLILNLADAGNSSSFTNGTEPTSSVFSLGSAAPFNGSLNNFIAYCFHSVPGMSDIGSYVGTGASGNSIVTGFRPAFLMIKNTTGGSSWVIFDNKRNPSNPKEDALFPNLSDAEYTFSNTGINFLSNGFSLISNPGETNLSGNTYIFLAIAEQVYNANGVTANQTNPFNDGSQIAQYEFEGNADDSQPNGYIGKGGTFDGSSSSFSFSNSAYGASTTVFTASGWFKHTSSANNREDIYFGNGATVGGQSGYAVYTDYSTGNIALSFRTNPNQVFYNSTTNIKDGNWHNVCLTYNNGVYVLYVDSVSILNGTSSYYLNNLTPSYDTFIGSRYGTTGVGTSIIGSADQVRIFNTALNPNDVWLLYSETSATSSTLDYPASTGAQALYELEGNADDTGGTYNGTDTAVAWVPLYDGTDGATVTYAAPSVSASFLKAGDFNGSSSKIEIAGLSTFLASSSSKSWSCWVKTTNTTAPNRAIISDYNSGGNYNFDCYMKTTGVVEIVSATGGSTVFAPSTKIVNDGEWHNIIAVQDTTANTLKLYIDSVEEVSLSIGTGTDGVRSLYIGTYGSGYFWNGQIDQARIFNKALDSGEILQLYNEPNN